ncbi:hypothetical protein OOT00_08410 [Desulfobotulus sp. H1]|uniref:Uncharacterized protein n=1 Tax=Desulfobotulus pelophilus TaxID=2823377 RepID=A0ABT3NAL0_9BACT|nr:hypothetical protein [Desulfobotulus pelophilus]MCW7754007.1 hypothetical protein [Desulfobotulus pelophilus]
MTGAYWTDKPSPRRVYRPEKMGNYLLCGLAGFFFFCFALPTLLLADPGFLWLEPGPEMQRRMGREGTGTGMGRGGQGDKSGGAHGPAAAQPMQDADRKAEGREDGASRDGQEGPRQGPPPGAGHSSSSSGEKRAAMSLPVHYTLRLGWPSGDIRTDQRLLQAEAFIVRPDATEERMIPVEEGRGAVRIRDAALTQGTYHVRAFYEEEDGSTRYRLFYQVFSRNPGYPPGPSGDGEKEAVPLPSPWFAIEDLSPDPGKNYARIHRKFTGDFLPLRVSLAGEPVADLAITLTTADGWQQTHHTDEKGEVGFHLIKERFHDEGVRKGPSFYYVTAEIREQADDSENPGEVLRTGLALMVYPTPLDWESKAAGFYVFMGVSVALGFGTAIRRWRRRGRWI